MEFDNGLDDRMDRDPERERAIRKRADQVPERYREEYLQAARGEATPQAAIQAFCRECVYWDAWEVQFCTAEACALWGYRPCVKDGEDDA